MSKHRMTSPITGSRDMFLALRAEKKLGERVGYAPRDCGCGSSPCSALPTDPAVPVVPVESTEPSGSAPEPTK